MFAEPMFSLLSLRARGFLAGVSLGVAGACGAPSAAAGGDAARAPRPLAVAGGAGSAPLAGSRHEAPARGASAKAEPGGVVLWRFHAGSAVHAAPAVGHDGTVYVGTGDGTLQALSESGTLRWSYTIEGAVAWPPVVDGIGRLFVATAAQRLYSFSPRGDLSWQVRLPAHVATAPALAPPWGLLFAGTDGNLWAYSEHAVALWHTSIASPPSAGPVLSGARSVVGASTGEVVLLDSAMRRAACKLAGPVQGIPLVFRDGSAVVLAGNALHRLGSHCELVWRREGIEWAAAGVAGLVAIDATGAFVRIGPDGDVGPRVPVGVAVSAPPREGPGGAAYVPAATGDLLVVLASGEVRRLSIARAALHRPVIDEARHRVVVTAGSGEVAAVRLEE